MRDACPHDRRAAAVEVVTAELGHGPGPSGPRSTAPTGGRGGRTAGGPAGASVRGPGMTRRLPAAVPPIEQSLRRDRVLRPGDRLPSDAELCAEFGVSRMTARNAMQRLAEDGLVARDPGAAASWPTAGASAGEPAP